MHLFKIKYTETHKIISILGIKIKLKYHSNFFVEESNTVIISNSIDRKKLHLSVKGKNNKIIINDCFILNNLTIQIFAENSFLEIGKGSGFNNFKILMGANNPNAGLLKNHTMKIGENVSIEGALIVATCGNTELVIGDNCMISDKISIYNADTHPIFKKNTKEIVNRSKNLYIGNHCWIGTGVTILKNTIIPDNSIIGAGSVVSGQFTIPNCILAGNPAKIIKTDVDWDKCGKGDYIENSF